MISRNKPCAATFFFCCFVFCSSRIGPCSQATAAQAAIVQAMPVHVRAVSLRGCQRFSSMTADARYAIADRELPRDSFFIFFPTVSLCIAECKAGEPGDFSLKVLDDLRLSRIIAIFVPEFN